MIRYKIAKDVPYLKLLMVDGTRQEVSFDHDHENIYFVDILENLPNKSEMHQLRIYMPDGNDIVGKQYLDWITLHHVGDIFDGRFNRVT